MDAHCESRFVHDGPMLWTSAMQRVLEDCESWMQHRGGVALLCGNTGVGKTTLLRSQRWRDWMRHTIGAAYLIVDVPRSSSGGLAPLWRAILITSGIRIDWSAGLHDLAAGAVACCRQAAASSEEGRLLLVIDHADIFDAADVAQLEVLQRQLKAAGTRVDLLFAGTPDFPRRLDVIASPRRRRLPSEWSQIFPARMTMTGLRFRRELSECVEQFVHALREGQGSSGRPHVAGSLLEQNGIGAAIVAALSRRLQRPGQEISLRSFMLAMKIFARDPEAKPTENDYALGHIVEQG